MDQDDWSEQTDANYAANKDYIDQQWMYMMKSWNEGVYFNAGMFYAYIYAAITASPAHTEIVEVYPTNGI